MTAELELLKNISATLDRIAATLDAHEQRTYAWTPDGLPICPRHQAVMKKREKQGDTWYSHRVFHPTTGEELFCRGYAGKSSPGFDVEPTPTHDDDKPRGGSNGDGGSNPAGIGSNARPAPPPAPPANDSELDAYFPRPTATAPPPNGSRQAMAEFNKLAATLISAGQVPANVVGEIAKSANVVGWTDALTALRDRAGIAQA